MPAIQCLLTFLSPFFDTRPSMCACLGFPFFHIFLTLKYDPRAQSVSGECLGSLMQIACTCTYSTTHCLTHPLTHSLTHSLTFSLTHSLSLSLTHSLTHSPFHPLSLSLPVLPPVLVPTNVPMPSNLPQLFEDVMPENRSFPSPNGGMPHLFPSELTNIVHQ